MDSKKIRTLRQFDERFTSQFAGFKDADDYYHQASSIRVIDQIRIPTLILHAEDDPFIPFIPLRDPAVVNNPYIQVVGPSQGGHVAFLSADPDGDVDRFWAENRLIEFFKLAVDSGA